MPLKTLENISIVVITLVLSYFTLVFGELVPKRMAMKKAESISIFAARPLTLLSKITAPFVKFLTASTNTIVRLFGIDPNSEDEEVTEEEIRMMLDVGQERGTIQESEKIMIDNIFEFDNKTVSEIMSHRTQIVAIDIGTPLSELTEIVTHSIYTRFPVFEQSIDNIIGTLHIKDIIPYVAKCDDSQFTLQQVIRKPYLVPSSQRTDKLFKDLQKRNTHMAIVIDEYGGTAGIVTLEDLLEEIVGNIWDEYDEEEKEMVMIDESTFLMRGSISLDDVARILNTKLPIDDYETLSGFLIGQLGTIPGQEDKPEIAWDDYLFKIEEADKKKIVRVKVCRN